MFNQRAINFSWVFLPLLIVSNCIEAKTNYVQMFPSLVQSTPSYRYFYWENEEVISWKVKVPDEIKRLLSNYYGLSDESGEKLQIQSALNHGDIYLVRFWVPWKDHGVNSSEADVYRDIVKKNCDLFSTKFNGSCQWGKSLRELPYALVDLGKKTVAPIPEYFEVQEGLPTALKLELFDSRLQRKIKRLSNRYYSLKTPNAAGYFADATYDLPVGKTRRCLAGMYALLDFDGDGNTEFLSISGRGFDDFYYYQVEDKKLGYVRSNMAVINIGDRYAEPVLSEEIFSYEMNYGISKTLSIGEGIYRDSKLFWGDFNEDGHFDYLVRRRQATIDFSYDNPDGYFKPQPYKESASLYLGSGNSGYDPYQPVDKNEFLEFIVSSTDWEAGFPEPHDCIGK